MFGDSNKSFAVRLKELREKNNLTQTELSELVGYKNYTTISKWESGASLPRGKELKILAEYFSVSTDYLLGMDKLKESGIINIYNQLNQLRQQRVYSYAEFQLNEQRSDRSLLIHSKKEENIKIETVPENTNTVIKIEGHGMSPAYNDGDSIFVQDTPIVENGVVAAILVKHEGVLKLVIGKINYDYDNQKIIIQSLNPPYGEMSFDSKEVVIKGQVLN